MKPKLVLHLCGLVAMLFITGCAPPQEGVTVKLSASTGAVTATSAVINGQFQVLDPEGDIDFSDAGVVFVPTAIGKNGVGAA